MRSEPRRLGPMRAVPAWLALGVLAVLQPASLLAQPMHMIMLCTGEGVKMVPAPGHERDRDDDCGKPCHALCQRKRTGGQAGEECGSA